VEPIPTWPAVDPGTVTDRPEPWRPQLHYSPATAWLNDPNGLVWFDGEYHLFFQHNPDEPLWGPMHWGHAVSEDLLHWETLPIALWPDEELGAAFSGSAVVDHEDSSGLCAGEPCLVAFFTHDGGQSGDQKQSVAFSRDRGRTWTQYAGNPVIPNGGQADFRDPKVLRWPDGSWRAVIAAGDRVQVWSSDDLLGWSLESEYAPAELGPGPVECPDLFALPVDGEPGVERWVLQFDVFLGGPQGGTGARYVVGDFDGTTFVPEHDDVRWVDFGKDFYAAQSFDDAPGGRRIWLAWMSSWSYALLTPTSPWRGSMSLPREVGLVRDGDSIHLVQQPVELGALGVGPAFESSDLALDGTLDAAPVRGRTLDLDLELEVRDASRLGLRVLVGPGEDTEIGWDAERSALYVDRTRSGDVSFSPLFPGVHDAPLTLDDGLLRLRVLVDWSSVEVFAQGGRVAITDRVFPSSESAGVELFAEGGEARVVRFSARPLASAWAP